MTWSHRYLERRSAITWPINDLVTSTRSAVSLLSFPFSYSGSQIATAKFIEIIYFANFVMFHVSSICIPTLNFCQIKLFSVCANELNSKLIAEKLFTSIVVL